MFRRISVSPLSMTATLLFLSTFVTPSHGIDTSVTGTISPAKPVTTVPSQVLTGPKIIEGAATTAGCTLTSVSPTAAEEGDAVVITGQGLSGSCSVYFQNPSTGKSATSIQIIDPLHMKVIVPFMPPGKGTIAVHNRTGGALANTNTAGHVLPFEVKPTVPVVLNASQASTEPGQKILLNCSNLRAAPGVLYSAFFISAKGWRVYKVTEVLNATTLRVQVPDMEKDPGIQLGLENANSVYITRDIVEGKTQSNYVPFKVLPAPRCKLAAVSPNVQDAKGYVTLGGSYITPDCDITFYTPTGQAFPAKNKNVIPTGLNVQVPDMPGGKGFVSAKPAGATQAGVTVPFEVRGLTPLLAVRNDISAIQGFGQKIMGIDWKTGQVNTSSGQPFKCDMKYEVYQNGSVYTYVYKFAINETVATTRYLGWMSLIWPDLNDSSLKYGVGLQDSKLTYQEATTFIKCETKSNLSMVFSNLHSKYSCGYIQSKRPPKPGTVTIADASGWGISMSDFMVPTP